MEVEREREDDVFSTTISKLTSLKRRLQLHSRSKMSRKTKKKERVSSLHFASLRIKRKGKKRQTHGLFFFSSTVLLSSSLS